MKIYHGSADVVSNPEIREPNRRLDYGAGFYATTSYEQAERWVQRKTRGCKSGRGFVNVYEFDEKVMETLKSLSFTTPTEEWVDFVMSNRTEQDFIHDFDIVYGPVANDRVYAAFALYEAHLISKQMLIAELKTCNWLTNIFFIRRNHLKVSHLLKQRRLCYDRQNQSEQSLSTDTIKNKLAS